uniref:Topoisomerase 6 subunit A/Spo11 TOPRIM domain-containing protein n=1 Tax=Leersia perrieri TaxID=77586 RepID=A0A0D9WDZ1_9ORYZ
MEESERHTNDTGGEHSIFTRTDELPELEAGYDSPEVKDKEITSRGVKRLRGKREIGPVFPILIHFSDDSDNADVFAEDYEESDDYAEESDDEEDHKKASEEPLYSSLNEQFHNNSDTDNSLYEDDISPESRPLVVQLRTLKSLRIAADQRRELRSKYIIAEGVDRQEALRRVKRARNMYSSLHYFRLYSEGTKGKKSKGLKSGETDSENTKSGETAFAFDPLLEQLCVLRLGRYKCAGPKADRLNLVLGIMEKILEVEDEDIRENIIHYMYNTELRQAGLKDSRLKERVVKAVVTITKMLKVPRESLGIRASPKGLIKGPLKLFIEDELISDCSLGGRTGNLIPAQADLITRIEKTKDVKFVLILEKDTVFYHLAAKHFSETENCILVTGKGQPDIATWILLRKIKLQFPDICFYVLVDWNPSGLEIFSTYWVGSEERAHDNLFLTLPDLQLLDFTVADVDRNDCMALDPKEVAKAKMMQEKVYLDDTTMGLHLRESLFEMETNLVKVDIDVLIKDRKLPQFIREKIELAKETRLQADREWATRTKKKLRLADR